MKQPGLIPQIYQTLIGLCLFWLTFGILITPKPVRGSPLTFKLPQTRVTSKPQFFSNQPMGQVNSVNRLKDISPGDWAYEALKNLIERYSCMEGYPNLTFYGERSLTRWEFVAGLNACLSTIERLIQNNIAVLREDIETFKRLAKAFEEDVQVLGTRISNLENRTAYIEDHQFSTTTKLAGSVVFSASDVYGTDNRKNNAILDYRTNLNFITSFTGKDLLVTSFFAGNTPLDISFNLATIDVPTPSGITLPLPTAEGTLSSQFAGNTNNQLKLLSFQYTFPVNEKLRLNFAGSITAFHPLVPTLNPYMDDLDSGKGSISEFGQRNPIYAASGGGTGLMFNYKFTEGLKLSAGYLADGLTAGNPRQGNGLFNGGYGALSQLTWDATESFSIAGVYVNEYTPPGRFGFNYNGLGVSGTAVANSLAGQDIPFGGVFGVEQFPTISNAYGVNFSWRTSPTFTVNGWFTTTNTRLIGRGDGNILTYALTFAFPDLGKEGNLLGFVVGAQPYLTHFEGGNPQPFEVDIPYHVEAFYRYGVNDNIYVTPGFIWLLAPNQDNDNATDFIGTIRTTFTF
ncbi:iron uptake porin [Crocosphaera chwakensis]|nr:iron uptake porin [Crocosphaera chwakensis]